MKKTLVALAVAAFATSASAVTVLDAEGTKVDLYGSVRLLLDNSGNKTTDYTTNASTKQKNHTNLHNDGSRLGVNVKHDLTDGFYAFGRLEFRFNGDNAGADKFGNIYAHRAYVGFGSKETGELSFGRQVTIGDEIAQAGFDNTYGVTDSPLTKVGKEVIRYDYKAIDGLLLSADYRFAEDRTAGEVTTGKVKSGYGTGAVYSFDDVKVAVGYTRDNFATGTKDKHYKNAFLVGGKYTIDALTLAADYGFSKKKNGAANDTTHGLALGAKYKVSDEVAVYGNYQHLRGKETVSGAVAEKLRSHRVMLGTEYKVHKNVFTFVEGRIAKDKFYNAAGNKIKADKNNSIGVGLRVHF